jgi:hypothetical protein
MRSAGVAQGAKSMASRASPWRLSGVWAKKDRCGQRFFLGEDVSLLDRVPSTDRRQPTLAGRSALTDAGSRFYLANAGVSVGEPSVFIC